MTKHSPTEHFAGVGYRHLAAQASGHPPGDEYEDEHPGAQAQWLDAQVLAALRGAEKPSKRAPRAEPEDHEDVAILAGVKITWHRALPELKVWAGRATLKTLIHGRMLALWEAEPAKRLMEWQLPLRTSFGIDPRSVATQLDTGFSVAALGMPIYTYVAAELLAVIGLQLSPLTRFAPREYGYLRDDGWWKFSVVEREGYHRMFSFSTATQPPLVSAYE